MTRERRDGGDTPFGAWLRKNPVFDSKNGYDAQNLDYIWHFYYEGKLMLLEEKQNKAVRTFAQRDTHRVVDKLLDAGASLEIVTNKRGKTVKYYGYHVIQFEKTSPDDGAIYVDGRQVTQENFYLFLQFRPTPDKDKLR